jgi:hypothetical protein
MKAATIALVVRTPGNQSPEIVEVLSDDREISLLESGLGTGRESEDQALVRIRDLRQSQAREDEEFADYVEELLSQPFVKPEIQEHGLQWLKSKLRIEEFQKNEREAAKIIADYALKVYSTNPSRRDFLLAGPRTEVRVRIFVLGQEDQAQAA